MPTGARTGFCARLARRRSPADRRAPAAHRVQRYKDELSLLTPALGCCPVEAESHPIARDTAMARSIDVTLRRGFLVAVTVVTALLVDVAPAAAQEHPEDPCPGGKLEPGNGKAIVLSKPCQVTGPATGTPKKYQYGNINIIQNGELRFDDAQIELWTKSILIENGGKLVAGSVTTPIGMKKGVVP